jgi:hypothetical protein
MAGPLTKLTKILIATETTSGTDAIQKTDINIGTGNASNVNFDIPNTKATDPPVVLNDIIVKVDGVTQTPVTDYNYSAYTGTASTSRIIFTVGGTPPNGDAVTVTYKQGTPLQVGNLSGPTPDNNLIARTVLSGDLSELPERIGRTTWGLSFFTEFNTSAVAGTEPPGVRHLLQAMGFLETDGATEVVYTPASTSLKTCTIYVYMDPGVLYKMTGVVGVTMGVEAVAGDYGRFNWTLQGLYNGPEDKALPTGCPYANQTPIIIESIAFTPDSVADLVIPEVGFTITNTVSIREDVNSQEGVYAYQITSKVFEWSATFENVTVATFDFHDKMKDGDGFTLAALVGGTNGDQIQFAAPVAKITSVEPTDRNGLLTMTVGGKLEYSAGNDNLTLTYT